MDKNKIKKIVTRTIAGVALAALVIINVQIGLTDRTSSDISLEGLTMSLFTPAVAATCPTCPDPNTLYMGIGFCPSGKAISMCKTGGDGCKVRDQDTCP